MKASYECFDRYPARTDVAEKVVPDSDPAKEIYSRYATECTVSGRPMLPQTMEFITDMGTISSPVCRENYLLMISVPSPGTGG